MKLSEWTQERMPFPPLTILVGKNGSGKTRLLRSIAQQHREQHPDDTIVFIPFASQVDNRLNAITDALSSTKPTLVIVDAIDAKLHPCELKKIMRFTLQCLHNSNLRVVYTCYSPLTLDDVPFDSVFVLEYDDDGISYIQPITASPKYAQWKSFLTAGEFWSIIGERWVIDNEQNCT